MAHCVDILQWTPLERRLDNDGANDTVLNTNPKIKKPATAGFFIFKTGLMTKLVF